MAMIDRSVIFGLFLGLFGIAGLVLLGVGLLMANSIMIVVGLVLFVAAAFANLLEL